MNEIMNATYEFIDYLDSSDIVKNLVYYKDKVKSNKELSSLLDKGKNTTDKYLIMDIKNKLYKNSDYQNYTKYYNDLFLIMMSINRRYKKLLNTSKCGNCGK